MGHDALTPRLSHRPRRASVTLVTLCLMTALGIALGSYLALCSRSAQLSARSVSVDQAHQLAETGLEEALWALNQNSWSSSGPDGTSVWSTVGGNRTVTLTYPLPSPSGSGQVALTVANYASAGRATWPTVTSAATVTLPSGQVFSKTLRAETGAAPLFANAIASWEGCVSFTDSGVIDSWNSDPDNDPATVAPYSFTAGSASNYNAVIAGCTDGATTPNGVQLMKATVYGYVTTFGNRVGYSTSGAPQPKVKGPTTLSAVNIDPARLGKSAFVPGSKVFTVSPPTSFDYTSNLLDLIVGLVNSLNLVTLGSTVSYKRTGDLTVDGGLLGAANLTIRGDIKLVIDGDLTIKSSLLGDGKITIANGGSLQIFVNGTVKIGGDGFDNKSLDPRNLAIYCTATGSTPTLDYTSDQPFYGVIYSENRKINITKPGPFYGAILARNDITFNAANPIFHYDTALRTARFSGITTPYILKRISEL